MPEQDDVESFILSYGTSILSRLGDDAAAREAYARLAQSEYLDPYYLATARAALGEMDGAIDSLATAVAERTGSVPLIRIDSFLDPLREHPKFDGLLRTVFPEPPQQ